MEHPNTFYPSWHWQSSGQDFHHKEHKLDPQLGD